MTGDNGNYYFRSNCLSRICGVGTWWKGDNDNMHSVEAQYDFNNAQKGIAGMPLFLRYGGNYKLGPLTYNMNILASDRFMWRDKTTFPLTDKVKLSVESATDLTDMATNSENIKPNFGATIEFNM